MKKTIKFFGNILVGSSMFGLMLIFLAISACDAEVEVEQTLEDINSVEPTITGFSPSSVNILETVTIEGTGLQFVDSVYVGDKLATISSLASSSTLTFIVPNDAPTGEKITVVNQVSRQGQDNLLVSGVSSENLTVNYPDPVITIPDTFVNESFVNQPVTFEGANLLGITSVTFAGIEAPVEFQNESVIVVNTPDMSKAIGEAGVDIVINYSTASGSASETIVSNFIVNIPLLTLNGFPTVISRDNNVTITGEDLQITETITVGGETVTIIEKESNEIVFSPPTTLVTGLYDVQLTDQEGNVTTQENVAYVHAKYIEFFDFANYSTTDVRDDGLLSISKINDVDSQPKIDGVPFGTEYLQMEYASLTGSTRARLYFGETTAGGGFSGSLNKSQLSELIGAEATFDNAYLHFWVRTVGNPNIKLYFGDSPRRELRITDSTPPGEWQLIAVNLTNFVTGGSIEDFHVRFAPGSGGELPKRHDVNWFIVSDQVLTEFGAIDTSDTISTDVFWKAQ
ncbi:hypothetical protein GCM10022393_27340 [Aquimarina addita]|uniref:IPT/TIG domain-containing protein n=1 Tax=Aquimarina addita TaxID=870485 RepID=A0ABP6UMK6_9FLAO